MMGILMTIVYLAVLFAITFGILILGRKYVFSKVKINKYIPLGISAALFLCQLVFSKGIKEIGGSTSLIVSMLLTIVTVTFFLWFMDIITTGGPKKKEKQIEIRPKAKPNRAKHLQNQKRDK